VAESGRRGDQGPQKREKKRQNVGATHTENFAISLKYCELFHRWANYVILLDKLMTCVFIATIFFLLQTGIN
jgi:hypothetical protein